MAAAIYARYSSENQRPESIDDQVSACRKLAKLRSLTISDEHIYADQAQSGARSDRPALAALMSAARGGEFDVVLVDDLSRLARDNHLMLSIIAELHFEGIRVISVADGLDSTDEESTLAIQVRGIFNELQLRDLKKKTLRGQIGQKERGFFVGEKTFGYRSVPVGEMKMDKKGRPRPDGYKMEIEPKEAAVDPADLHVVRRGHVADPDRQDVQRGERPRQHPERQGMVARDHQPDPRQREVRRPVDLEPHREPTGSEDRTTPAVRQARVRLGHPRGRGAADRSRAAVGCGPGAAQGRCIGLGPAATASAASRKSRAAGRRTSPPISSPARMVCGSCGATIAQVSGKSGGYYGCLAATKGACDNKTLVRRTLAEKVILGAIQEQIADPEHIAYVLQRVEEEIANLRSDLPDTLKLKEAELTTEQRRLANFVDFIGEGRGSQALAKALVETERRVNAAGR